MRAVYPAAFMLGLFLACCQAPAHRPAEPGAGPGPEVAAILAELEAGRGDAPWPAGPQIVRTTSADIYLGNLDSRIKVLSAREDTMSLRDLATLRWYRYRILGRLEDAEAALDLAEQILARTPADARALMVRGAVLSGFHRFDEARRDLLAAARTEPDAQRALDELDLSTGRYRELAGRLSGRDPGSEGLYDLALRGNLALTRGEVGEAEQWFRQAQLRYRDVSPLPLAWLHTQQGIAWLRLGELERARDFFDAAHRRLPGYYLAAEHLAETDFLLGRLERARELYREVVEQTGQPEFIAALAAVEAGLGHHEAAEALEQRAREGFDVLLERHPAAFAEHAARFYLDIDEAEAALKLARLNLESRRDVMAWLLLAEAEHAAGYARAACRALARARLTGMKPPEFGEIATAVGYCR